MKFQLKNIAVVLFSVIALSSCNNDSDSVSADTFITEGSIKFKFDNVVGNGTTTPDDFKVNETAIALSNGEVIKINRINYVISNLVLVKEDGTEVAYSKDSLFIINEDKAMNNVLLSKIPVAKYKKLKFGLGVEKSYHDKGEAAQQKFWDYAKSEVHAMTWAWTAGYKFINFEGTFTSPTVTEPTAYKVHLGGYNPNNNYREITVDFPEVASVNGKDVPSVHLFVDVKQILDGVYKHSLTTQSSMMMGDAAVKIADNAKNMFTVDHVHNH